MSDIARSSWGVLQALVIATAGSVTARDAVVAVVLAVVLALIVWVLFHVAAPAYEAVAAIITFLIVLLALLFL